MGSSDTFAQRLQALDVDLFSRIVSQSSIEDRRAWLAVQRSIRRSGYVYLETGSYLGGSIQQHLVDPLCRRIFSIDGRLSLSPDDRGESIRYPDNSTEQMLANLRRIDAIAVSKVATFDADARNVNPAAISEPPHFCFIDGEHTRAGVVSDFDFCLGVCAADAVICFHDARIVDAALREILTSLSNLKIQFTALQLGGDTFGIFLRGCPVINDPYIREHSTNGASFLRTMRVRKLFKAAIPKWTHPIFRNAFPPP